jgi:DNA-binding response OmpR family regulator
MFKALLVEDDEQIVELLEKRLSSENFSVDVSNDGNDALIKAHSRDYDIILLDLILPGTDGLNVLKMMREENINTPTIAITGIQDQDTKIKLLNSGADDYIVKPFSSTELIARMHAVLRRTKNTSTVLEIADLKLNSKKKEVYRADKKIQLRNKEFELLEYLMKNEGFVVTRSTILEQVWKYNTSVNSNTIDAHIATLRKKVDAGHPIKLIHTIHAVGFKLCIEN